MGMFDYIRCNYPMPLEGANARIYQTKDTPAQLLDNYEIRVDGSLWHQSVDYDDKPILSDFEPSVFTGEIRFYDFQQEDLGPSGPSGWIEWSAYFTKGKIVALNLIENR